MTLVLHYNKDAISEYFLISQQNWENKVHTCADSICDLQGSIRVDGNKSHPNFEKLSHKCAQER